MEVTTERGQMPGWLPPGGGGQLAQPIKGSGIVASQARESEIEGPRPGGIDPRSLGFPGRAQEEQAPGGQSLLAREMAPCQEGEPLAFRRRRDDLRKVSARPLRELWERVPPGSEGEGSREPAGRPGMAMATEWTMEEMLRLMAWGREQGMSDLILTSSDRPWMRVMGKWVPLGGRKVHLAELTALLNRLSRNEAAGSMVGSGLEMDFGCELQEGRLKRLRFRGNATAVADGWSNGLSVTLRVLPEMPPDLETLEIEPELAKAFFPDNGLVLVTGVMGSGKSTLLAAALRRLAETGQRHIATYEAPIEFDLFGLPKRTAPVEQTEIPRHLGGFVAAARNVTRRAADAVLIGESRDPQTIRGLLEAAEIGVTAYTTAHTRSVADTPLRLISVFAQKERASLAATLLSALRVIVQQRLYPGVGGGRRAVREFLVFDQDMRSFLQREPLSSLGEALDGLVRSRGQTLEAATSREVEAGRLAGSVLEAVLAEKRRSTDA